MPAPMALEFACRQSYPGGFALDLVFSAPSGVTALFGPSGSGKTSALEMIAGIRRPAQGVIAFNETTWFHSSRRVCRPPHKRGIGAVFQDQLLFPHLTVAANLRYGARRKARGSVSFERVVQVLELEALLAAYPGRLSGGERQRVALGRALLCAPCLLLMDEPLTALDDPLKHRILNYLERIIAEWEVPVLFVSHSQSDVRRLANWVVAIENGRNVAEGAPTEALARPEAMRFKNSAGPMNLLKVTGLRREGDHWSGLLGDQAIYLPPLEQAPDPPVYVELPPNAVMLSRAEVPPISARNRLHGTVRRIVEIPEGCFVAIDIGQVLWAEVTPAALRDLELAQGVQVVCLIKTHSLRMA